MKQYQLRKDGSVDSIVRAGLQPFGCHLAQQGRAASYCGVLHAFIKLVPSCSEHFGAPLDTQLLAVWTHTACH
jgi:hypothetical protein